MRTGWNAAVTWFMALVAALQFLTRMPIPIHTPNSDVVFRRSTVFFPAAGLLIGAAIAAAGYGLGTILPVYVNAVLVLVIWVSLSGGLHLDGLMDSADGLLSHRSRERMLEIMKDSRVGAMGVIVGTLYLLLKAMLLIAIFGDAEDERYFVLAALALIPVWSRAFMVTAITGWPYAREGQGLGQLFRTVRSRHAAAGGLLAAGISVILLMPVVPDSWGQADFVVWMAAMPILAYGAGAWMAAFAAKKLGGLTGDVYGALNECLELVLLLALTIYLYQTV